MLDKVYESDFTRRRARLSRQGHYDAGRQRPDRGRLVTVVAPTARLARISIQYRARGISIRVESRSRFSHAPPLPFFATRRSPYVLARPRAARRTSVTLL